MNIEEYISSGILESYVLGELPENEAQEVLRIAQQYPEVREELENIERSLEALAQKVAVKPSSEVKERLYQDLGFNDVETQENASNIKQLKTLKYAAAAAVILMLLSSALVPSAIGLW